jgi:hypothetical protein
MVHQAGTRERELGQMIRITAGAGVEALEVGVDLCEDEGGVGVGVNLEIPMAQMTMEVGRAHGVATMLQGPLGGVIVM